jgi:hypothetical protein
MRRAKGQAGEYVSAHVSQADKVYNQLLQSGVGVEGWRQNGEVVTFRTAQPAPTHRRRSRWWLWIVGAVVAFFVVAGLLKAGILAASVGASMAGVILFGVLGFIVWKAAEHRSVGFWGTTIAGLICAVMVIGAVTSIEPLWNEDAATRQAAIAAECGGVGSGDVDCRLDKLAESGNRLIEVWNSPASEGLGAVLLGWLALTIGGGWLYWKSQGL